MKLTTFARSACLFGLSMAATLIQAENIKGRILDKETGEPLVGALVKVTGSAQGAVTDVDGNYTLKHIPAGTYTIEVTYIGYTTLQVTDVQVAGKDLTLDLQMDTDTHELGEVTVVAQKNLESERALMMERQKASFAIENMGAKEMSLKGVGNVQEGLTKITGISVADAGQLIVRGLGDRYSTTTLNGLPIASPNPDNKLIPLDIFPTATVQNITVSKVYEPEVPGLCLHPCDKGGEKGRVVDDGTAGAVHHQLDGADVPLCQVPNLPGCLPDLLRCLLVHPSLVV